MDRLEFLTEFLGALGAASVTFKSIENDFVLGTVHYSPDKVIVLDEDDLKADFCWHMTEKDLPNELVYKLARLLNQEELLSIDKIIVPREELRAIYNKESNSSLTEAEFNEVLDGLKQVRVDKVYDGEVVDMFFIHE